MKVKKVTKQIVVVVVALVGSIALGAILAKVSNSKGLSAFLESSTETIQTNSSEISETTQTESSEPVQELTYVERVNQDIVEGKLANHLQIKLMLQTDERWQDVEYGSGNIEGNNLKNNGCAILSLAMIASFLDEKEYTPMDILDWAKNDYYLEGQGTAWAVFSDFAMMKGYQFQDLIMDTTAVEDHLKQGHPIIVSVKPGLFTETGHIMVISGTNNGNFWVNDPNDSEEKAHSIKEFSISEVANESVNFWAIYK